MDDLIRSLKQMTEQFVAGIDEATDEQLLEFVDRRQAVIDQLIGANMSPGMREHYASDIADVLAHDETIMAKLLERRFAAVEGMNKMDSARKTRNAYQTDYAYDSIYIDKKK